MSSRRSSMARVLSAVSLIIIFISSGAVPAFGQTGNVRRRPRLRTHTRTTEPRSSKYYTVQAGETLRVRMNRRISSETARVGDRFTTKTVDPVYAGGVEVIPAGSTIAGRVTTVTRASRKSRAGAIGVTFYALDLPSGFSRSISGALTDLNNPSGRVDPEGTVTGRSAAKRNVVFVGGGAGTGALIGAIAGGGKGAGIGAGVGAGLGVAGAYFSKGKEAVVESGTEFGVLLNRSIALPAANVR